MIDSSSSGDGSIDSSSFSGLTWRKLSVLAMDGTGESEGSGGTVTSSKTGGADSSIAVAGPSGISLLSEISGGRVNRGVAQ